MKINLVGLIDKRVELIAASMAQAKKERDEAATPMESHSDQTRSVADQLYQALEGERDKFLGLRERIKKEKIEGRLVEVKIAGELKKFLIVPEGLGGMEIDGVFLLADKTPLAKSIMKSDEKVEMDFKGNKLFILRK